MSTSVTSDGLMFQQFFVSEKNIAGHPVLHFSDVPSPFPVSKESELPSLKGRSLSLEPSIEPPDQIFGQSGDVLASSGKGWDIDLECIYSVVQILAKLSGQNCVFQPACARANDSRVNSPLFLVPQPAVVAIL